MSSQAEDRETTLCPSGRSEPGAILLGAIGADGRVGYLTSRIRVDPDFLDAADSDGDAARRFRFAQPCVEGECRQWQGGRCSIGDAVADHPAPDHGPEDRLPHCSIRAQCRWHKQSGPRACHSCALVITDPG